MEVHFRIGQSPRVLSKIVASADKCDAIIYETYTYRATRGAKIFIFPLLYLDNFLYSVPHAAIASMTGRIFSPRSLKLYSTLGGTSG